MTNEEIIQARENYLATLDDEMKAAYLAEERAHDIRQCLQLSRTTGVHITIVEDDPNSLNVDGEVMGYNEFQTWLEAHMPQEEVDEEEDEEPTGFAFDC